MENPSRAALFSSISVFLVLAGIPAQDPAEPVLGKVVVEEARVFAMEAETQDATLPERLPREALVVVRARGSSFEGTGTHFYKIGLPGGVPGYVHGKLLQEEEAGWGTVTGSHVFLRPTASSQKIPIATLALGTRLRLLGKEREWYRVLASEETAVWMRAEDLALEGPIGGHAAALDKARAGALAAWQGRVEEAARQADREAKRTLARRDIADVEARLKAQAHRNPLEVDLAATRSALAAFKQAWPDALLEQVGLAGELKTLESNIENLQLLHEMQAAHDRAQKELEKTQQPPATVDPVPAPVKFWKDAFVGHLRRCEDPHYTATHALMMGGQVVAYLHGGTDRYLLKDFEDYLVLVRGEASTPPSLEGRTLVSIRRLEVLGTPF